MNSNTLRIIFSLIIVSVLSKTSLCQEKSNFIFGKVGNEELLKKSCEIDSSAEAEFLYDKENIEFFVGADNYYHIQITYYGRLKIYKKSGLDRGTVILNCSKRNGKAEYIKEIKGYTYNYENGTVISTPLKSDAIFVSDISKYATETKINAPDLKVGSIFEYSYTRIVPFPVQNKPNTWYFQGNIPYKWSEVSIVIPKRFFYRLFYRGYVPLHLNETKDTTLVFGRDFVKAVKHHLVVKNVPAFISESYISSWKDCITKLEFELSSYKPPEGGEEIKYSNTWKDLNKLLIEGGNFGAKLNKTSFLIEIANNFNSIADTLDKVKAVLNYVSTTLKWNGALDIYSSESLEKAFENKTGSGAQINMILVALLRRTNINANPAIISTKSNGEINEEFPLLNNFNYTIAHVKIAGKDVLMDATDKYSKPNMLPYHTLCKKAFVVEKNNGRLITYSPNEKESIIHAIDYEIFPESNEIKGKYTSISSGYTAMSMRNSIEKNGLEEEVKELKKHNQNWQLERINIENKDRVYLPLKIYFDFSFPNLSDNKDQFFFNPLSNYKYSINPLKEIARIYPVDFGVAEETVVVVNIKIPPGYSVSEKLQSGTFYLPDKSAKFSYVSEELDGVVKIRSHISFTKCIFSAEEYQNLRELFFIIVEKQSQQIILKKI